MLFSITSTSTTAAAVVAVVAAAVVVATAAVVVDTALSPLFIRKDGTLSPLVIRNDCAVFPWVVIGSSRCCVIISIISGSSASYNGPSCISTHKRGEVEGRGRG